MTTEAEILSAVIAAVREETGTDDVEIARETTADDVPGWDSLAHVRIVMNVNQRLACKVEIKRTYAAGNVGELVDIYTTALKPA